MSLTIRNDHVTNINLEFFQLEMENDDVIEVYQEQTGGQQ